jgi:hypothetical protein
VTTGPRGTSLAEGPLDSEQELSGMVHRKKRRNTLWLALAMTGLGACQAMVEGAMERRAAARGETSNAVNPALSAAER